MLHSKQTDSSLFRSTQQTQQSNKRRNTSVVAYGNKQLVDSEPQIGFVLVLKHLTSFICENLDASVKTEKWSRKMLQLF